jgi:hypothetical protein
VFYYNTLTKQLGSDTSPYQSYTPYSDSYTAFLFGWDASTYHHLDNGGTPITDWANNETLTTPQGTASPPSTPASHPSSSPTPPNTQPNGTTI